MLSRTLGLVRLFGEVRRSGCGALRQAVRHDSHGTWHYREAPGPTPLRSKVVVQVVGSITWFWILWHLFTEPEHLYGEFPQVYPEKWTDAELGIPPDSEGLAPVVGQL